ncbi:MAG: ATP-binding protein [Methanoregula sp.]|nr:ATP-binding protein [Methanoregula sp.]
MGQELDFKISSGLKNIIGRELITNDLMAIFELVKNSYDADANKVRIVFENVKDENKQKGSRILVIDDGKGMSYEDLINKWLFVGYSDKKDFEKSLSNETPNYRQKIQGHRVFAGQKGIGRFSCDRLGSELILLTKKENETEYHKLQLNWKKFEEDAKKEFHKIKVNYEKIKPTDLSEYKIPHLIDYGTILIISSLNDKWDDKKLVNLKRYLQRLINPSEIGETPEIEIDLEAKEFIEDDKKSIEEAKKKDRDLDVKVINGIIKNIVFEKLGIKTTQISCIIDESGEKIFTELRDKNEFIFSLEEKNDYRLLKNTKIKIFFLNKEAKQSFSRIMGLQPFNYGSIFLYKNRFRVHPYGDEGDDWLGLETRKGQGYARYLSNRELMGRIEVNGYQPDFKEVSSRDGGVIKTDAFYQLNDFFHKKVLRRLERYVAEGIDWDSEAKTPDEIKADSLKLINKLVGQISDPEKDLIINPHLFEIAKSKQVEKLPEVLKNIESLKSQIKSTPARKYIETQLKAARSGIKILETEKKEVAEDLEATKKTALFLDQAVSADKDILMSLNHSIKITTFTIERILKRLNHLIKEGKDTSEMIPLLDDIKIENDKIRVLSSYVSLASFDTKVESIKRDLVQFTKEYLDRILLGNKQDLKIKYDNDSLIFPCKFKPLEISIIFENLVDNSRKAGASWIRIKYETQEDGLHIFISDNGNGIPETKVKHIFDRGYTTTNGSGLGLFYVNKLMGQNNGEIKFVGNNLPEMEKGACFEVTFR